MGCVLAVISVVLWQGTCSCTADLSPDTLQWCLIPTHFNYLPRWLVTWLDDFSMTTHAEISPQEIVLPRMELLKVAVNNPTNPSQV